ncbi:MAG: carbohydrate binding domain-containing protein [Lachnospiraceae bacterium]|nr:carbohydrate binding domain-containing protein [Lachnospiraceae bacterium]
MNYTNKYAVQQFIYIAQPGKRLLGVVGGVDYSTAQINKKGNNTVSLSFVAYESFNGEKSAWYDYLDELMEIFVDGIWFIIKNPPEVNHDGKIESKTIEAESYEIGLQNYDIQRFKIGQGTESSYEMMFQSKYPKEKYPDKYKNGIPTVKFYNPDEPELSLLHILLHHAGLIPSKKVIDSNGNEIDNWTDNIADSPWQIGEVDTMPRHIDSSGQELENPTYLPEDSYAFNIDNSDLYSVLTQDVSNAFSCIFTFDTINCKINATYVDHIGKDTNAYIGWRNIQNSLKATRKDELFTTVTVSGGEGIDNIVSVNFGDTDIEDYSYLLEDERYIPTSLKEKYKAWVKYRESKRLDYINLQKKYVDVQEKATEVKSRVPIDGSTEDWSSKSIKDLMQAYDDYTALIRAYESEYIKEDGSFDLDALKKSADWDRYEQIVNYILPTIINKLVSTTDSEANDIKESLKDYGSGNILKNATFITSSNWYGIGNSLSECNVLDTSPVYGATRYMTIHSNSDSCGIKQKEISTSKGSTYTLSAFIRSANANKIKLGYCSSNDNNDYSKVTYIEKDITSTWTRVQITFTAPSDISEIYFLCEGTNIAFDITAPMLELGESASTFQYFQMDEEYQKSYLTDWKLYGVDELTSCQKKYSDQMGVLERYSQEYDSSITDSTEEVYNSYHQLYLDYKKLYDDCTSALAERQKEYDNLISERNNYKSEYDTIAKNVKRENFENVQTEYPAFTKYEEFLLKKLYKHTDYKNENIISTSITSSVEKIEKEYKLYLDAVERLYAASHPQYTWEDTLDNIYGLEEFQCLIEPLDIYNFIHAEINNNGTFEKLRVTGITYNPCIYQGDFTLTFSSVTRYKTKKNDFNDLLSSALSAQKNALTLSAGNSKDVTSYTITPEFIKSLLGSSSFNAYMSKNNAGTVSGITGNFTNLYSKYIDGDQITAQLIKANSAEFKTLVSESIQTDILTTKILNADKGFFKELTTQLIKDESGNVIIDLVNKQINTSELNTTVGNIKHLLAGTGTVGDLEAIHLTAANVVIDEGVIKNLIASKISVADLMTHSATAELITLISSNGNPSIAFKDSTQQFYDKDGNIRVQIGQDGNGNFNFIVKGTDGKTAMFDENGITQEGIPDSTIIGNMISNDTISKSKLNFPIVETDKNGNISIKNILDGSGNLFGVKYTEFQNSTNESLKNLNSKIDNSIPFEIRFVTPQGVNTSRKISQITVKVNLFQNGENVTDKYDNSCFTWERSSYDSSSDKYWNEQHSSGAKTITINRSDVMFSAAYFTCTFSYDGEALAQASIRQSKSK